MSTTTTIRRITTFLATLTLVALAAVAPAQASITLPLLRTVIPP